MSLLNEFKAFRDEHKPHSVTHNKCRWEYLMSGSGDQTIVVLHGNGTNADSTWEYIRGFEKNFRVVAPTVPAGVTTMRQTMQGIAAILRKEGIERAHFFGFSMGAMVAQCFLRAYPEMTGHIVLFSGMPPDVGSARNLQQELLRLQFLPEFVLQFFAKRHMKKQFIAQKTPQDEIEYWLTFGWSVLDGKRMNKASLVASMQIMLDYASHYHFEKNDMKGHPGGVMIIDGAKDPIANPQAQAQLRELYPEAELLTIANGGHASFGSMQAESVLQHIRRFLTK